MRESTIRALAHERVADLRRAGDQARVATGVRQHLQAAKREGRFGVVAVVCVEESQRVWSARNRSEKPGVASLDFFWEKRRVGAYYF